MTANGNTTDLYSRGGVGDRVRLKVGNGAVGEVTAINIQWVTVDWGIVDPKIGRIVTEHHSGDLVFIERADAAQKRQAEIVERLKAQGKAGQG